MVKNLLSKGGDTGLIPGWGTKIPRAAGKLKPFCFREPLQHNEDSVQPKKGKKKKTTHTKPQNIQLYVMKEYKKKKYLTEPNADKNAEEVGPSMYIGTCTWKNGMLVSCKVKHMLPK